MSNGYDYRKYAILYVDDEEQSLKYFRKAFEKEFQVLTASSVGEAVGILDLRGSEIGVVITDQRMPGRSGVDLLGLLHQQRPAIVRILTTAYSDLDSAIEAVNSGAIYKYIVKPWDIRELRGVLLRALEFFTVQTERDILFREKLAVLQRLIITDRVRSFAVLAAGFSHHIRNSMTALKTFLDLIPIKMRDEIAAEAQRSPQFWEDLWSLANRESQRILQMVQRVAEAVVEPSCSFKDRVQLADLLKKVASHGGDSVITLDGVADLPELKADAPMLERLVRILADRVHRTGRGRVAIRCERVDSVWGAPGVRIAIRGDGPEWNDDEVASFFTAFVPSQQDPQELGLDLLAAFFIAYHHGGDITVHKSPPAGPGFELLLPFDPDSVRRPSVQEDCLGKLFLRFETQG